MRDSKLISLLMIMTAEDLRKLQKMLRSPFFTSNKNLLTLFKLLRSHHPDFDHVKLDKQLIFRKIFPSHTYSDIKFRNLSSELVGLIEDYFLYKDSKENDIDRRMRLLNIYRDKKLFDLFKQSLTRIEKDLEGQLYRGPKYYEQMLKVKGYHLEHPASNNIKLRSGYLEEWGAFLDQYYLLAKSRQQVIHKSFKNIFKLSDQRSIEFSKEENELLFLYQELEKLIEEDDPTIFLSVKERFEKNIPRFRKKYQLELHSLLVNFAIRRMAIDDVYYNQMVFDLYKVGLKYDFYLKNNMISGITFFNIVVSASKAKDFDWAMGFIKKYLKFLNPVSRVEIKRFSLSIVYFHKKEFTEAIDQIIKHRFKNIQFKLQARVHFIRCYYEMYLLDSSYFDLLMSKLETTDRFFRRNSDISQEKLTYHFHFLNFVKKLAILRLNGILDLKQQIKMRQELEKRATIMSRSWLIEILKK